MTPKQTLCLAILCILAIAAGFFSQNILFKPLNEGGLSKLTQSHLGKITLLNFWATWCPPCREEIPDFIRLHKEFKDRDFSVIGLAIDQPDKVNAFELETGINYPSLIVEKEGYALMEEYGSAYGALPYTVILDRRGNIVYKHQKGILSYQEAKTLIEPLL